MIRILQDVRYSWPHNFHDMRCELGQEFDSHWGKVIFIRSTRKGFNFFVPEPLKEID